MTDAVHINDYAAPQFSADVMEMLELGGAMAESLPFDPAAIQQQAADEVGFGSVSSPDEPFVERMQFLLDAYVNEGGISGMGHVAVHTLFVQLCRNRLLIADMLEGHPEIADIEIKAPIIIAGLPRTGTTHLHNLLAADPALRSLPYWESCEPVAMPHERGEVGPRHERAGMAMDFTNAALPYFKRMHEMDADHIHEEIQLLSIDFSSMFFETLAPIPSWRDRYLATDQEPHYQYLKSVLQVLTFLRGGDRWVLKSPQHLEQFETLMKVFPDMTVIVTHRDPVAVTASMATMLAYTSRIQQGAIDPAAIGGYWADRLGLMLNRALEQRDALPAAQSMDVRFAEFMADDMATVAKIYKLADQPLDDAAQSAHRSYVASHERARHGGLIYRLEDFGLDETSCAAQFADYSARFL